MDLSKKLRKFATVEEGHNYDPFWTLDDNCSQGSLSTTYLSVDTDEFKYMDDDCESSSSDEIYSLETSLIDMNKNEDLHSLDEKLTHNQNYCYHHQASPIVGRTVNFYDNDNFIDDTLIQLANKGFAQSLSKQVFVKKHNFHKEDASLDRLLSELKEKQLLDVSKSEKVNVCRKITVGENSNQSSFDGESFDNEDLISISSHGSNRSETPINCHNNLEIDYNSPENLNFSTEIDNHSVRTIRPKLLKFTDSADIDLLSPADGIEEKGHCNRDVTEEYSSTTSGDCWQGYRNIEISCNATLYHQPPKSADRSAAQRLARRLFDLDGFKLSDVSKHLSKRNDFNQLVGEEFTNYFEFTGLTLDYALRRFLDKFVLYGDTQERERIIHHFSRRYIQCNTNAYNSEEACHTLVCALMLLNTDLHGITLCRKMGYEDFIVSMTSLNGGENFQSEELEKLFNSILENPIRLNNDNELIGLIQPKMDYIDISKQISVNNLNFSQEVAADSIRKEYMSGYLLRKCIKESHFKKTSMGKRGWKLYFGRLQDLTLCLYKDEIPFNSSLWRPSKKSKKEKRLHHNGNDYIVHIPPQTTQYTKDHITNGSNNKTSMKSRKSANTIASSTNTASDKNLSTEFESASTDSDVISLGTVKIYLSHSFSCKATDYIKKRNVFRLQINNGSEYLFQVNEPREVDLWVDCLNFVAALLSPPVFSKCDSKDLRDGSSKILDPILTTFNIKEQLNSHQKCILSLEQDLTQINSRTQSKSDKTRLKWQHDRQRKFIERELIRYRTYSRLLEYELIHMHNLTMARISQQSFIDPAWIPVQYSAMPGSATLFYNQQTNQLIPLNCVSVNTSVFQHQLGSRQTSGCAIKELSEEPCLTSHEPITVQPIIVRPPIPCNRTLRSQLNASRRRRYKTLLPPTNNNIMTPIQCSLVTSIDRNSLSLESG